MAFKILNDEEISLLTDEQVECYQKELKIYKQREDFVEKLTKLENAEIKPYKPNLKSIDIIREIEFAPFISPERKRLNMKPMQKLELPDDLIGKASEKIGGMITLNETLKDIWKLIEAGKTKDQIIDEMVKRYDVTREAFSLDLDKILADLKAAGIFNDD